MIFQKTQADTKDNPNSAVIKFSPKSVAFNSVHSVYVDIFIKPSTITKRDTQLEEEIKENLWVVLNYFEVTTFDADCDFLWGETIDDSLDCHALLTMYEYDSLFDVIAEKPSMIHRKMQKELEYKKLKNSSAKI